MSTLAENSDRPSVDFDQEVRFAVVLYGGSSLAIYINGVAQELLRLVRATAPECVGGINDGRAHLSDEELRGSERVYRRLGRVVSRQRVRPEYAATSGEETQSKPPIRTRFVVDIITGTSAGGINGVYLAKALANNQDMDELKQLWVSEGDIGVLINDDASYKGLLFGITDDTGEPWSVLNSRRMYLKLLQALRGMDRKRPACPAGESPLVDELDLFVTGTDMQGRILQLRLADKVVSEYRHRNVFRFRYRSARASEINHSEFGPEFNAFLAFVARATSAHQAAFSPIKLDDVTPIVGRYPLEGEFAANAEALRAFYNDYLLQASRNEAASGEPPDANTLAEAFRSVWFVDGGTLDNKPFSFVVGELPLRHANTFVDRKLLYVEPSPEHLGKAKALKDRPKIVQNALAALSSLPRYETIVEDLTRLLERNRMIERLDNIMRGVEADLTWLPPKQSRTREQFLKMLDDPQALREWMQAQGPSWGSYLRLRVGEVTDDLTLLVTRAAGFNEESDEFLAIRYLVRDWRASRYNPYMTDGRRSELEFLVRFDLLWAMRRIKFVIKRLNDLAYLSEHDTNARRIAGIAFGEPSSSVYPTEESEYAEYREASQRLRSGLNEIFTSLRAGRRRLWSAGATNPFIESIARLRLTSQDLLNVLHEPTDEARRQKATQLMSESIDSSTGPEKTWKRLDAVEDLAETIKKELAKIILDARNRLSETLRPPKDTDTSSQLPRWELFLRKTLWYYYISFEDFDQISYPLLYSTGVGAETDVIDVFRVSPEDATALINENFPIDDQGQSVAEGAGGKQVRKLAGTTLGNFGAFFEQKFRINDIMWGRLDAAERIIATVLPADQEVREEMIKQAHRAIIVEENLFADQTAAANNDLQALVWRALDVWDNRETRLKLLDQAAQKLPGSEFGEYLNRLRGGAEPRDLFRQDFARNYDESRQFTADATLKSAVRVNRVINSMAGGYLRTNEQPRWWQRLIMLLGRGLRTFIEAAIQPDGPARRKQVWILTACYILAALIFVVVSLPAFLLWRRNWWPELGGVAIVPTVLLALIPLALTITYSVLWRKLKRKLVGLLPRG
jgi:patatin-related protein